MEKPVFSFHVYLELQQSSNVELYVSAMILFSFCLKMWLFSGTLLSGTDLVKGVCSGSSHIQKNILASR